jgi:hypothetical protein
MAAASMIAAVFHSLFAALTGEGDYLPRIERLDMTASAWQKYARGWA